MIYLSSLHCSQVAADSVLGKIKHTSCYFSSPTTAITPLLKAEYIKQAANGLA